MQHRKKVRKTEKKKFKSIHVDTEKRIYEINGEKIPDRCSKLSLEFDNGEWLLLITTSNLYASSAQQDGERGEKDNRI